MLNLNENRKETVEVQKSKDAKVIEDLKKVKSYLEKVDVNDPDNDYQFDAYELYFSKVYDNLDVEPVHLIDLERLFSEDPNWKYRSEKEQKTIILDAIKNIDAVIGILEDEQLKSGGVFNLSPFQFNHLQEGGIFNNGKN